MKQYDTSSLIVHSQNSGASDLIVEVRPEQAGWEAIHFQARRLTKGQEWSFETGGSNWRWWRGRHAERARPG
jgi:5-deoxy-D-glucuronate isomerase